MNTIVELGISESEARPGTLVFAVQIVAVVVVVLQPFQFRQDVALSWTCHELEKSSQKFSPSLTKLGCNDVAKTV